MTIKTVGTTTNFVVTYQDTDTTGNIPRLFQNAERRAANLLATCEEDFSILKSWFGLQDGFGAKNPVTLQVETASWASNNGYKSDKTTLIRINPFDNAASQEDADDAVQSLFVAEMIEILMGGYSATSWHPNKSDGVGLSRVAAATLHPVGYYRLLGGPFVNPWLKTKRSDSVDNWVKKNADTDTDK